MSQQEKQAQLPLPFHPSVMKDLSEEERSQIRRALARLLLAAARVNPEDMTDEQ